MREVDALTLVHWGTLHLGGVTGLWLMLGRSLGCLNCYWPSAHPGSLGRLSGALNFHWLSGNSFSLTFWDEARREELPMGH